MAQTEYYGTGRRKTSIARIFLRPGTGVNQREPTAARPQLSDRSAPHHHHTAVIRHRNPGDVRRARNDVRGGVSGQAGAMRLGIARALVKYNAELRPRLKKAGLLSRDPRIKERKKYGLAGARKRFQFSKR